MAAFTVGQRVRTIDFDPDEGNGERVPYGEPCTILAVIEPTARYRETSYEVRRDTGRVCRLFEWELVPYIEV